jgi:hypothetical protein
MAVRRGLHSGEITPSIRRFTNPITSSTCISLTQYGEWRFAVLPLPARPSTGASIGLGHSVCLTECCSSSGRRTRHDRQQLAQSNRNTPRIVADMCNIDSADVSACARPQSCFANARNTISKTCNHSRQLVVVSASRVMQRRCSAVLRPIRPPKRREQVWQFPDNMPGLGIELGPAHFSSDELAWLWPRCPQTWNSSVSLETVLILQGHCDMKVQCLSLCRRANLCFGEDRELHPLPT